MTTVRSHGLRQRFRRSIRTQLLGYSALYCAVLIAVVLFATLQIHAVSAVATGLNRTSLPGTRILAELKGDLFKRRHAETMRMNDPGENAQAQAHMMLDASQTTLRRLKDEFAHLDMTANQHRLFERFGPALDRYLGADEARNADSAYAAASSALASLEKASNTAWTSSARSAEWTARWTFAVLMALSLAGLTLTVWLMFEITRRVSKPIAEMTLALSALASGNLKLSVPGAQRPDEIGQMASAFEIFRRNVVALDEAHKETEEAQKRADSLARHDALTGLPNRRVFGEELAEAAERANTGKAIYGVALLDLDHFKPVNDIHGHPVGDIVLCEVARRLTTLTRENDTVARLGGDEFALVVECKSDAETFVDQMMAVANRVIAEVSQPIAVGGVVAEIGVSIGIAECPEDGCDADTLLRAADIAMYRAKNDGRGTFRFFEVAMDEELKARVALEAELRHAIANGEIQPHYQPIMSISQNRVHGFEVLARWHHADKGVLPPSEFIPLAEEIGLISDLTYSILRHACREASGWQGDPVLSVNIAPQQLQDNLLPTMVMAILSETGFPPHRLELEITESALVADLCTAKAILEALKSLGIMISLDDFGTGYSSLYHLRELPLDKLKVDRSFVQSMTENVENEKLVNAILGLSRSLGMPTVAEGIEDVDALGRMAAGGCEFGQGFYFGKAMSAADAEAFVSRLQSSSKFETA